MGLKPIALSFKNTPEEMELYAWIISHSNMSGFIKDILKEVKEKEKNPVKDKVDFKENKLIDLDF